MDSETRKTLEGGRDGIYREGDNVYRPASPWTPYVHDFLNHLHRQGFHAAPRPVSLTDGQEVVSFVPGEVSNYPLSGAVAGEKALLSAARLLRDYHQAAQDYPVPENARWMLPPQQPQEVLCHGDFAPYNLVMTGDEVTGVIDFDTLHPGPRVWDVAYAVYCWAPFKTDEGDKLGDLPAQIVRAKQFCDAYGLLRKDRADLVDWMIKRIEAMMAYMCEQAEEGNRQFQEHLEQGHLSGYQNDLRYLTQHRQAITQGLL